MEVAEVATAAEDDPELLNTSEKITINNTHSSTGISRLDTHIQNVNCHFQMQSSETGFQCPHPGCKKSYTRKYGLKEHLKSAHDVVDTNSFTRNFFNCGVEAYRTNRELLHQCDKQHQDLLGKMLIIIILNSRMGHTMVDVWEEGNQKGNIRSLEFWLYVGCFSYEDRLVCLCSRCNH